MIISDHRYKQLWFFSLVVLLWVQYLRPQELIPGLQGASLFLPVTCMVFGFLFLYKHTRTRMIEPLQIKIIFAYVAWYVMLVPFSQVPGMAVYGLKGFITLFPFILSIPVIVTDTKMLKRLVDVFIFLTFVLSIIGLVTHGAARYEAFLFGSFLTDPNDFSLFMNTMFPISLAMFMYTKGSVVRKTFYLVATILAVTNVIASYSRGGFLGLVAVCFVIWTFSPNKKVITSIALVGALSVVLLAPKSWTSLVETSIDTKQSTAQTRLETWKLSWEAFLDHPYGIGFNNTPGVIYKYSTNKANPERWRGNVSHSFWFTALSEGGIIGFSIIIFLIVINIKSCLTLGNLRELNDDFRFLKYIGRGYLASLTGFLASGTFLTVNTYPHLWYLTALIAISYQIRLRLITSVRRASHEYPAGNSNYSVL